MDLFTLTRGKLFYNYEPTDAAWEEAGNALDNTISVGGANYYALAEKDGKIGPILGYNSNKYFDYTRFGQIWSIFSIFSMCFHGVFGFSVLSARQKVCVPKIGFGWSARKSVYLKSGLGRQEVCVPKIGFGLEKKI